jgi:hypothetical protein
MNLFALKILDVDFLLLYEYFFTSYQHIVWCILNDANIVEKINMQKFSCTFGV